jgi:hypothetical protein
MNARTADVSRETRETRIRVKVNLDGTGQSNLSTGIGFFDPNDNRPYQKLRLLLFFKERCGRK